MTTKAALVRQGLLGAGTRVGSGGVPFALALLAFMEAGIPIPIPADLVMLFIGERVSAGAFPLWAALVALECVAVVGTTALFLAIRGPGKKLLDRFGPRMGVTRDRLERSRRLLERRGTGVTALGRSTPGLRTVTVVAAAGSGLEVRRALPALLLGSTIFVQGHFLLGLLLGPAARAAYERLGALTLVALVVFVAAGIVFWVKRRGQRAGSAAWAEASCPACLAIGALTARRDDELERSR